MMISELMVYCMCVFGFVLSLRTENELRRTDACMDGWLDRWISERMDGWVVVSMDGCVSDTLQEYF